MYKLILTFFLVPIIGFGQITIVENIDNITLIGKVNLENTDATSFLPPKIKVNDGLTVVWDKSANKHFLKRKEANNTYNKLDKSGTLFFGDLSSSLIHVKDKNKYLLTFKNKSHDYEYESFWLSKESIDQLYLFIDKKLGKKSKWKNYEIVLDNDVVLVLSFHKKKMSFSLWDHYKWYHSSWYKSNKINNLFGKN
jgi:hypothetical protein